MVTSKVFNWAAMDAALAAHPAKIHQVIRVDDVIEAVSSWRAELEQAAPLEDIRLRADLVLGDVCHLLGLTEEETARVLGR